MLWSPEHKLSLVPFPPSAAISLTHTHARARTHKHTRTRTPHAHTQTHTHRDYKYIHCLHESHYHDAAALSPAFSTFQSHTGFDFWSTC